MNRIGPIVLAALALLTAAPAHAQQRYDPAIPRGMPEQQVEPAGTLTAPAPASAPIPPRLVQNERRAQRDADARQCLTLATNKDVHRCSLKYRSQASRAGVVKASAKPPAAPPSPTASVEPAKPADVMKPGPVKPGDAAKAAEIVKPMDVTKSGSTPKPAEPVKPAAVPPPAAKAPEKK